MANSADGGYSVGFRNRERGLKRRAEDEVDRTKEEG